MEAAHEAQRKEMNQLFEREKTTLTNDYEGRLSELDSRKSAEFEKMRSTLQNQIDDLLRQLEKERENM